MIKNEILVRTNKVQSLALWCPQLRKTIWMSLNSVIYRNLLCCLTILCHHWLRGKIVHSYLHKRNKKLNYPKMWGRQRHLSNYHWLLQWFKKNSTTILKLVSCVQRNSVWCLEHIIVGSVARLVATTAVLKGDLAKKTNHFTSHAMNVIFN